jgi:membrane glycosyltransferase
MTPEEDRHNHTEKQPKTRRTVRLTTQGEVQPEPTTASQDRRVPTPRRAACTDRLLRVAELVVGDWAPTLHEAFLRMVLFAVVVVALGVALGAWVTVAGAFVGFVMFLVGRRRAGAGS